MHIVRAPLNLSLWDTSIDCRAHWEYSRDSSEGQWYCKSIANNTTGKQLLLRFHFLMYL